MPQNLGALRKCPNPNLCQLCHCCSGESISFHGTSSKFEEGQFIAKLIAHNLTSSLAERTSELYTYITNGKQPKELCNLKKTFMAANNQEILDNFHIFAPKTHIATLMKLLS